MLEAAPIASTELVLGRYRPLRPLGSGGSGSVWLALDTELGVEVALKIVAREGKAAARAEREARAAASLRHPRCQRILAGLRSLVHQRLIFLLRAGGLLLALIASRLLSGFAHHLGQAPLGFDRPPARGKRPRAKTA